MRENFMFFDTASSTLWKLWKFTPTEKILRQNFYLKISLGKLLLSQNVCQ